MRRHLVRKDELSGSSSTHPLARFLPPHSLLTQPYSHYPHLNWGDDGSAQSLTSFEAFSPGGGHWKLWQTCTVTRQEKRGLQGEAERPRDV